LRSFLRCIGFSRTESLLGIAIIGVVLALVLPPMKANLEQEKGQSAGITAQILAQEVLDHRSETGKWPVVQENEQVLVISSGKNGRWESSLEQMKNLYREGHLLNGAFVYGDDVGHLQEGTP